MKTWSTMVALVFTVASWKCAEGDPHVPCYFIFGDSLADNGNNNDLQTLAKVNYPPYGIDFPLGPTGRFCNGRTVVDIIAEFLAFEDYISAFAYANGTEVLYGVNYASGSAGILDETGKELGERIPFNEQLQNHKRTISSWIDLLGDDEAATLARLSKCLYSVGMGNNDFINNYFVPQFYNSSRDYTLDQFIELLLQKYTQQLQALYEYGARKIAIFGLGVLGCTPAAMHTYGTNGTACVEIMDVASVLFNTRLLSVVDQLNDEFSDAQFIYINSYGIGEDSSMIDFTVSTSGCCQSGDDGQCVPNTKTCENRTEYVFWDSFHPTEALNIFTASRSYNASGPSDAYPFDIRTLVSLDLDHAATMAAM